MVNLNNRLKRLSRTGIEYGDFGWNFYPGCLHKQQGVCPVPHCWAEGMAKRQKWDFHQPYLIPELLLAPLSIKKPSTILVNFMGDLFGNWVDPQSIIELTDQTGLSTVMTLRQWVKFVMEQCSQHTFLFLTKNPKGLLQWGEFPDNAWVGVSVCDDISLTKAYKSMMGIKSKNKWLSIEPLLEWDMCSADFRWTLRDIGISWVVIGGQSNPIKYPEMSWIENIVNGCDDVHIPVWLKNNFKPLLLSAKLRQELPRRIKYGTEKM